MQLFDRYMEWMEGGTSLFSEGISTLGSGDHDRKTLLPDWNVAQLIAHVNSNARALVNLTFWARTGVERPMYESNDQRVTDIDEGAKQSLEYLKQDFNISSGELASSMRSLTLKELDFKVKSARGRVIPASEAAWIRIREVWIHAVDLAVGISFSRFPQLLLEALLDDVIGAYALRRDTPPLELVAADTQKTWRTGQSGSRGPIGGTESELLAWLIGRSTGETLRLGMPGNELPNLPPWL